LIRQHVLTKGFRRARNFGFLHANCKRLIALLHLLLKFDPNRFKPARKERPAMLRACCGAVMADQIVASRDLTLFVGPLGKKQLDIRSFV